MEQIVINKKDGTKMRLFRYDKVSGVTSAEQEWDLTGQDVVNLSIVSAEPLVFDIGDTFDVFGRLYSLNLLPAETKVNDRRFEYDIQMEGVQYDMIKVQFLDVDDSGVSMGTTFSLMGDAEFFLKLLINNLKRIYGQYKWELGEFPADTDHLNLDFQNESCLAALQKICDTYKTQFDIERYAPARFRIHVRKREYVLPDVFKYGRARGLYSLQRIKSSDKNIITRLFAYGAVKNLPLTYRGGSQRLKMPLSSIFSEGQPYIEDSAAVAKYGIIEGSIEYDDIFPQRTAEVTDIVSGNVMQFYDTTMNFNLTQIVNGATTYLIDGMQAKIVFKTGNLAGYEFNLDANTQNSGYVHSIRRFTILPYTDDSGNVFPSATEPAFQIQPGDKYTILDVAMPQSYITDAEYALEQRAGEYLYENSKPHVQYGLTVDANYIQSKEVVPGQILNYFSAGDYVKVLDPDLRIDGRAQIQTLKRNILKHYEYDLTLSDEIPNGVIRVYRARRQKNIGSSQTPRFLTPSMVNQVNNIATSVYVNNIGSGGLITVEW